MAEKLSLLNFASTLLLLVLGWAWSTGRWTSKQETGVRELAERLGQFEQRLDRAGGKMSDLSDQLQIFTPLAYRVDHLEEVVEALPQIRDDLAELRGIMKLRRNGRA